jgi:taurine transport system ATP-binding protein
VADESILELKNVNVTFSVKDGELGAVSDVNLSVIRGEFICIVGPSGCGKTTLLNVMAGFIAPTSGEILFDGQPLTSPGWQRGVVFQRPALYPWLTVAENVEFGPKMRGLDKQERQSLTKKNLDRVKLWEFRNMPPYELSGGMQQRVALARVLANDPEVLLMDEPFGALDALTREHLQEEMLRIWKDTRKTVVFVTHSVEEALYLATTVLVMSERPGRILADIASSFSQDYLGKEGRNVKSLPEFVKLREEVLGYIWH